YSGVNVMPVTVLGADGTGLDSDVISGVVWATQHGADVILMSFSNPGYSPALQSAINWAWGQGVVLVAAVGNEGSSTVNFADGDQRPDREPARGVGGRRRHVGPERQRPAESRPRDQRHLDNVH